MARSTNFLQIVLKDCLKLSISAAPYVGFIVRSKLRDTESYAPFATWLYWVRRTRVGAYAFEGRTSIDISF